jgi:NAD(P)-dependent dehydrogenase (short-subunit alcohol dehydrogenase family)
LVVCFKERKDMSLYLITGANRGLGLEFCRQLTAAGHDIWALCRTPERAFDLKDLAELCVNSKSLGTLTIRGGDVCAEESLQEACEGLEKVDVLINNAGIIGQRETKLKDVCLEQLAEVMDTNVYGIVRAMRVFLPFLRRGEDKRIVNITSLMGSLSDNSSGRYSAYRISKAGVNMLTRNIGHELGSEGFVVVALHPGWVQTDMGGPAATLTPEDSVRAMIRTLQSKTSEDSGGFFDRLGHTLPF